MGERSLKQEMREAVRADRERAEARRKAEAEGAYVGPKPPTLDLNRPTREWRMPAKQAESQAQPVEPDVEAEVARQPEADPEPQPGPEEEPSTGNLGFLARLKALFR